MAKTDAEPITFDGTLPSGVMPKTRSLAALDTGGGRRDEPSPLLRRVAPVLFLSARVFLFAAASPLRPAARRVLRRDYRGLQGRFDRTFYLSQIVSAWDRRCAARDPLLHYLCVGRHLGLSPDIDFDPRHYRDDNASLPQADYLHFLRHGAADGRTPNALARKRPEQVGAAVALALDHQRGGGSTRYLDLYERCLADEGFAIIRARRLPGRAPQFLVAGQRLDPFAEEEAFVATARRLGVGRLVMNHYIDLPVDAAVWTRRVADRLGIAYEVILHDYFLTCRRIDLIDRHRRYCGLASAETCRACLGPLAQAVDPGVWRERSRVLLAEATRIVAPSADLADRIAAAFPGIRPEVFEPEDDTLWPAETRPAIAAGEALRLAVIGSLNVPKGFDVLARLARTIARRGVPIEITVLGTAVDAAALRRHGVPVTGRYRETDIDTLIARHRPHAAFFPAIWPETWSFVLSTARNRGRTPGGVPFRRAGRGSG
ncbi:MAG TPA: hypothetical protein VJY39_00465 [Acidisphaera sp.]|nr:hypothetical protein [Acidisphaera sp.]